MRTHRRPTARAAHFAATTALLLNLCAASPQAQTPAPKEANPPGSVSGRVTTSEGHPAAKLALVLVPADIGPDRRPVARGETDADGRYRLAGVPSGRYRLQLLAPAHSAPETLGGNTFSSGRLISVGAGESIEDVDLTVARGGVITGRVTAADGKPVIGVYVRVLRPDARGGPEASVVSPFEFDTDDRGVYRVYGLPAGRYHVAVGEDRESGMVIMGVPAARYPRTFHPGVADASQARPVEVTSGGEATGVDITLAEAARSFQASGRIVDADTNQPVVGMGYGHSALVGDGRQFGGFGFDGSKTNQEGEFTIRNLVPGRYMVFASQMGEQMSSYGDPARFEIVEGDVSGLVIKLRRGATVAGTAVVEGTTDRGVIAKISMLRIYANVRPVGGGGTDTMQTPSFGENRISPDGTFRVTGLRPGRVTFNIGGFPPQKGFTLLRVERGGTEVPREGLEIAAGEQLSGVRLVIGYGTGVVRGQVSVTGGALPEGARLNVTLRRAGATTFAINDRAEVDARGRFSIEGLTAGEYELTLNAFARSAPGATPARFPTVRQSVSVLDAGEVSVTLVYDLGKTSEPNP